MPHLKRGDRALIVIAAACAIAAVLWLAVQALAPSGPPGAGGGLVVVCQNQEGFRRVDPLSRNTEYTVTTDHGAEPGYNKVRIANGSVDVTEADCSNQVCVEHAPISQAGEQIVCLPHGMVVEVLASEDDATQLVLN